LIKKHIESHGSRFDPVAKTQLYGYSSSAATNLANQAKALRVPKRQKAVEWKNPLIGSKLCKPSCQAARCGKSSGGAALEFYFCWLFET